MQTCVVNEKGKAGEIQQVNYPIYAYFHSKLQAQFQSMEVRNSEFAAFIDTFTPNTYVMVIMSDPSIRECSSYSVL